jgi:uncharacterized protein (TIGR03435 family)
MGPFRATVAALSVALCPSAQTLPAGRSPLTFEVASIKPAPPGGRGGGVGPTRDPGRYTATNISLKLLVLDAYRLTLDQIEGGPEWIDRERYDVLAKPERPSSADDMRIMLQTLLAQRFQLHLHHETRRRPIYSLVVERAGQKLTPAAGNDPVTDPAFEQSIEEFHRVKMKARSVPLSYFAWRLSRVLGRPVIDETNATGSFDFDLTFVEEVSQDIVDRAVASGRHVELRPSIFEAVEKQLGLRLESRSGPVDVIVIDHAEKPGAN